MQSAPMCELAEVVYFRSAPARRAKTLISFDMDLLSARQTTQQGVACRRLMFIDWMPMRLENPMTITGRKGKQVALGSFLMRPRGCSVEGWYWTSKSASWLKWLKFYQTKLNLSGSWGAHSFLRRCHSPVCVS
ncbi:hypothetical protein [Polaromonas sp.]|uniref:hypothetical protein n=1 Tax=Polaromonas sp. TaxID=1869339 RepID=UPI00352B08EA